MSALDPLRWKLALAVHGVRVDGGVGAVDDHATVALELPGAIHVAAARGPDSPYALEHADGEVRLRDTRTGGGSVAVRLATSPRFLARETARGVPMRRIASVQGSHLVVHAAPACGFATAGAPCRFCVEGARGGSERAGDVAVADVVETVRAAFEEGVAEHVLFNGSPFEVDDGGMAWLTPYVEAVRRHFDTLVAVQVHPPRDLRWADRAYAMGVDALAYPLELYDPDALARHCVGRARYVGHARYLDALAHAAQVFPRGTVWSELVAGLEAAETTRAGIDALVERGVVPVLALPPAATAAVDADALAPLLRHLHRAPRERGLALGWIRDLGLGITPLEARFAAGDDARLPVALLAWTRSGLGAFAARGLARFRRRLRVKSIGDSFDAARL